MADCMVAARALYGDQEGVEAYVYHNFGGIGQGSRQWDTAVEAVHLKVALMTADMMEFASGYEVDRNREREIIHID